MAKIQTREVEALKGAHAQFRENETDSAARTLAAKTATIFGWTPEQAKMRIQELLWEIGLVLGRGLRLTEEVFLKYAASVHEGGFIPMAARP